MSATPAQSDHESDPSEQLVAIDHLLNEAKNLTKAQEREVERLRAAGLDTRNAEGLLDAYRMSVRITAERKQELEQELAGRSSSSGSHDRGDY